MITRRTALLLTGASLGAALPLAAGARDGEAPVIDPEEGLNPDGLVEANPGFNFDIIVGAEIVNVVIPSAPVFPPPSIPITITEAGVAVTRTLVFGAGMGDFAAKMEQGGTVGFTGPGGEVIGSFEPNTGTRITGQMVRVNGEQGIIDIPPLDLAGVNAVIAITAAVALSPGESIGGATLNGGALTPAGNATVVVTIS